MEYTMLNFWILTGLSIGILILLFTIYSIIRFIKADLLQQRLERLKFENDIKEKIEQYEAKEEARIAKAKAKQAKIIADNKKAVERNKGKVIPLTKKAQKESDQVNKNNYKKKH